MSPPVAQKPGASTLPQFTAAASLVPSAEEVIDPQPLVPAAVWSVHVAPPSVEV
jgi:hypothetical protein